MSELEGYSGGIIAAVLAYRFPITLRDDSGYLIKTGIKEEIVPMVLQEAGIRALSGTLPDGKPVSMDFMRAFSGHYEDTREEPPVKGSANGTVYISSILTGRTVYTLPDFIKPTVILLSDK